MSVSVFVFFYEIGTGDGRWGGKSEIFTAGQPAGNSDKRDDVAVWSPKSAR